jgi:ketol-acid reductoisomerase
MHPGETITYHASQADPGELESKTVSVIGFGNQGRAQALNLRDHGVRVIVGNQEDAYREKARQDHFEVFSISEAASQGDFIMLLLPDEVLPEVFSTQIAPVLKPGALLSFASGYTIAYELVAPPDNVDVVLIAPRMIGVGVRERFLTGEGFYCFVGVHQDVSGQAAVRLLALTQGIGGLQRPAIQVTFRQEALLDLFNEQAFGPAFGRVLLTTISVLLENGIPPEAALVEMYMSEEMAYTYRKMAQVGLVKQTLYHSHTSQYGAMSRGARFMDLDLKSRMQRIYEEIDSGSFAREWQRPISRLKFKAIRFFAMRQFINRVENKVRQKLGLETYTDLNESLQENAAELLQDPALREELEAFRDSFEY